MSISPSDMAIHGYRSRDLSAQTRVNGDTLFASNVSNQTYKVDYATLSSDIMLSAIKLMNVGTMAFAETWEYSKKTHQHSNYTYAAASTVYGPTANGTTQLIGRLSASNLGVEGFKSGQYRTVDIYCLSANPSVPSEPAYGTLRFMYKTPNNDINPAANDFDGWVYPDGTEYTINEDQFSTKNKFVTRTSNPFVSGNKLKVPDLRGYFFKLNPFTETTELDGGKKRCDFLSVAAHTCVPRHEHTISKLSVSAPLELEQSSSSFKYSSSANKLGERTVHGGKPITASGELLDNSPFTYKVSADMGSFNIKVKTTVSGDSNAESYPTHYAMPVMIYVGGRKKPYGIKYIN